MPTNASPRIDGRSPVDRRAQDPIISGPRSGGKRHLKLRDKLFLSYALLSIVILLAAAWAIDRQVVEQARRQVREEMKTSLPLYDAVWEEQAGRLSALGMAMAGSPIAKTIFGDPRASRDAETIRQMLSDFGPQLSQDVDLVVITDGGGNVVFVENRGSGQARLSELPSARVVARSQKPAESFELLDGRFFHLALSPVVSHSGSAEVDTTLVVLIAGSELNRRMAEKLKGRARSDVLFFTDRGLYSSSLDPGVERVAGETVLAAAIGSHGQNDPTELAIAGESNLAFARRLASLDGAFAGHVVVLHSLGTAGELFRAISRRLAFIGTIGIVLVLLVSYYIARRVTQPIESLAVGAREFGKGNYEHPIDASPNGEIGQLASAFEQMRLSIRRGQAALLRSERLATIGQMASGIIHDLRSPLAAMSTAAEVFARTELPPEKRHVLADSQLQASRRMEAMLKELLEFGRGRYALKLERRELAPLIDAVTHETIASDSVWGVTAEIHVPAGIFVRVDCERVRRLFANLLVNSVQAMPEGGTITIRAAVAGQRVRVHVADTGTGIPAQLRNRLFEPFASHGKPGGTGLGLAIAGSIAEAHGGSLALASGVGEPTEFCVELPLAPEEPHDE
jgi:signal transduction histidine kinase